MAEITWNERAWCEQARGLARKVEDPSDDHARASRLGRLLAHVEAGWKIRAGLDAHPPDAGTERLRRAVVRGLAELKRAVDDLLAAAEPEGDARRLMASRLRRWTIRERAALQAEATQAHPDALRRLLALDAARGDLEWFAHLLDRLEGAPGPGPAAWLEVELAKVRHLLEAEPRPSPKARARREALRARCERMRGILLERRVRKELDAAYEDSTPERLASVRNKLSRLQARVGALESVDEAEAATDVEDESSIAPDVERPGDDPEAWTKALAARREEVAERLDASLLALPPAEAARSCERIVQGARDELAEMIAFLQDAPLRRAVLRLETAGEDLDRLADGIRATRRAGRRAPEGRRLSPDDVRRLDEALVGVRGLRRNVGSEWQEKLLTLRLRNLLGARVASWLENVVLLLIVALSLLIVTETFLDRSGGLSPGRRELFAWLDLFVCSGLLAEFTLRLILAPAKGRYLVRHFAVDFLASLPFGFLAYALDEHLTTRGEETLWLLRYLRLARILELLRLAIPVVRLMRLVLFALRLSDRLVRRNAGLLNRNILLFEPSREHRAESGDRHRLASLRADLQSVEAAVGRRLHRDQQDALASRRLADLAVRLEFLPDRHIEPLSEHRDDREIPVEALVERLIQLTPETLVDRMGQGFVNSVDAYIRVLDVPLVRRLPLIRSLVAHREKSPAEAVTLAANYVGYAIQRGLDVIYFLADLQATLSPAIFLDRLGLTLVNATRTPAKRLLWLGTAFLVLFLVVNLITFLSVFRPFVDAVQRRLGWPVIVLGAICLAIWSLGSWLRKIANQSADFSERIVEAQFASQTKTFKARRSEQDARFLAERVVDPELAMRAADDHQPELYSDRPTAAADVEALFAGPQTRFANRELTFLRNIRLLYQDYLDGSPFHRSDVKTSVQLLGNLALANLRRSRLDFVLRESRALGKLDLSRAGGLLGGPYLWFNYITRIIVQETAVLLLDYNANAVPLDRLACSPPERRRAFQVWLAERLRIDPDEVRLPAPNVPEPLEVRDPAPLPPRAPRRHEAAAFLETVEFTAMDFLADEPERDAEILGRFGPQVAELVRKDRQQNVRRAFRSFPLQDLPPAQRTINPYTFYEARLSGGRIALFPLVVSAAIFRSAWIAVRGVYQGVHHILNPRVSRDKDVPADSYAAAHRKIHRMRKPVFMGSLWLRARLDVEYLGLRLPSAPASLAFDSTMESDLDFIGASRKDRIIADQIRRDHQRRLAWTARWLRRFGWTLEDLPAFLAAETPYLANRAGEALRALVAACALDHDDVATLALSIEALTILADYAASPTSNLRKLPTGLPDPILNPRRIWRPVPRKVPPWRRLFDLPQFARFDAAARKRITTFLRRHRRVTRGWFRVVLGQGGADPWAEVRARLHDVLLKTDLWSDQILILRAVQTLTMLDVHHNCELVWSLGGYEDPEPAEPPSSRIVDSDAASSWWSDRPDAERVESEV
ncbi:ion transporter [Paludisphaera soli]|uniref:ion transporter n=1 Tax=Paludisphaera soli TaxID=2712865 RepID=UPI0013EC9B14|nr:ion transporter [Paludisphaera soli]